jgi:3-methylcrotonyl-CoA carboxylase alpha subunit
VSDDVFALAALAELLREDDASAAAGDHEDRYSPWHSRDGWRLGSPFTRILKFRAGHQEKTFRVTYASDLSYRLDSDGAPTEARGQLAANGALQAELGGRRLSAAVIASREQRHTFLDGRCYILSAVNPLYERGKGVDAESHLSAPMPGRIIAWVAAPGRIRKGAPLLIMEAMKMEHTIRAPADGILKGFRFAVGDQVAEGADLVDFTPISAE